MTVNSTQYKYGSALFPLFLVQKFDTVDHKLLDVVQYIFEECRNIENTLPNNSTTMEDILTAISNVLSEDFNTSFNSEFKFFMLYNSTPDAAYTYSPKNRIGKSGRSWGTPNYQGKYTVFQQGQTFSNNGTLPYLASHYYKFDLASSTYHSLSVTMSNELQSTDSKCEIGYIYHNASNDTYFYYSTSWGSLGEWTNTFYLNPLGVDEIYLVFINTGDAGSLTYSLTANSN